VNPNLNIFCVVILSRFVQLYATELLAVLLQKSPANQKLLDGDSVFALGVAGFGFHPYPFLLPLPFLFPLPVSILFFSSALRDRAPGRTASEEPGKPKAVLICVHFYSSVVLAMD